MKNNFLKNFLVILSFFIFDKVLLANEFTFNAKQITLSENGSIITATNGIATSLKDGNKIEAKSFEYNKKLSILTAGNAIASFKTNPIKISANIIKYDNNLSVISAYGNVKIVDVSQKILIKSEKITYNEIKSCD